MNKVDLEIVFNYQNQGIYSIEFEKKKYIQLGGDLPNFFKNINEISKDQVIQIIREGKEGAKTELLAILFWGIYFRVLAKSPSSQLALISFIENPNFEEVWKEMKKSITHIKDSKILFTQFSYSSKHKIPGLDYAYFTKIFHFISEAFGLETRYPILDMWTGRAWCAIDSSINNDLNIYSTYFRDSKNSFSCRLQRKKSQGYAHYIQFLQDLEKAHGLSVIQIEQHLFGGDLGSDNSENNPRKQYLFWAQSVGLNI